MKLTSFQKYKKSNTYVCFNNYSTTTNNSYHIIDIIKLYMVYGNKKMKDSWGQTCCDKNDNTIGQTYIEEIQCSGNEKNYVGVIQ